MEIEILPVDNRAFLRIGESTAEVKDYKISSPMHGRTELEVILEFEASTTEFLSKANSSTHSQLNQ